MAAPVWVLSVDLQTKTATFQSGMAEAAKSARSAFKDIQGGSSAMNREVGVNMFEARHGVMLLTEEFGGHLPRAITSFIADIGPVGAAMEAAFPFLAIAVGATLLIEKLVKIKEEGIKLTEDQLKFGTAVANAFNSLDEKILQAGIKADDLNKNHLSALHKQLELIDKQSMAELVKAFGEVAKAADVVFKDLHKSWYQFGEGSNGAKAALDEFQAKYDSLLAQGKDKEAGDLLKGTRESAEHILAMQKQYGESQGKSAPGGSRQGDYGKFVAAANELKRLGIGITEDEIKAQQTLVDALRAQGEIQEHVNTLKKLEGGNVKHEAGNKMAEEEWQRTLARLESDRQAEQIEKQIWEKAHREAVQALQQSEKEKIEVTDKASAERLAAIDAAIQEENKYGLQETSFYLGLLNERLTTAKAMQDEADKQDAQLKREAAQSDLAMGQLRLAAERESQSVIDSARRMTLQRRIDEEIKSANEEFGIKLTAFAAEIDALNKHDKDYEIKLKALQDKEKLLIKQHQDQITAIQDKAEMDRNTKMMAGLARLEQETTRSLASVIMQHQSFGAMILSLGDRMAQGMLENAIKSMLTLDMTKEKDAAKAARKAYGWGLEYGGPIAPILAPTLAATAFAAVMAFDKGGIVPGVGRGDIVPAMLTPGEGVLPKKLMDRINDGPSGNGGNHYHVHVRPTYHVNTIDGDGMRDTLNKHTAVLQQHFESSLRRMNK